jgi:hypothetical protein
MTTQKHSQTAKIKRVKITPLVVTVICCIAALLRISVLDRQELWVDEIFSLAMATGHSLEHSAALAQKDQGDFIEPAQPVPASMYRRYMEHEQPAVGPSRVVRAVLMSDTSPPLYYLLLNAWTRCTGTSDQALRLFSVFWSIACIPILASIARRLGGRQAVLPACVLFALAPQSIYYSVEGRMYSLLWFLVLATAWLTLELHRQGMRVGVYLLWIGASAAGMLTHYFFTFVWFALCLWLFLYPSRFRHHYLALAVGITAIAVLPWYLMLPQSMSSWRVTQGWLEDPPAGFNAFAAQVKLSWSYFAMAGLWPPHARFDRLLMLVLGLSMLAALWRARQTALGSRWQMLWLWLAASNLGLLFFDLWQGSYTREYPRYALAGLPAAFLLVAVSLTRLPTPARVLVLATVILLWVPSLRRVRKSESWQPFREIAKELGMRSSPSDVILTHSIPSGVLGIARYFDGPATLAPWVGQLGSRQVPRDVKALIAGRRRVFLVKIHDVGQPAPEESYLRGHAAVIRDTRRGGSQTIEFVSRRAKASGQPIVFPMP